MIHFQYKIRLMLNAVHIIRDMGNNRYKPMSMRLDTLGKRYCQGLCPCFADNHIGITRIQLIQSKQIIQATVITGKRTIINSTPVHFAMQGKIHKTQRMKRCQSAGTEIQFIDKLFTMADAKQLNDTAICHCLPKHSCSKTDRLLLPSGICHDFVFDQRKIFIQFIHTIFLFQERLPDRGSLFCV